MAILPAPSRDAETVGKACGCPRFRSASDLFSFCHIVPLCMLGNLRSCKLNLAEGRFSRNLFRHIPGHIWANMGGRKQRGCFNILLVYVRCKIERAKQTLGFCPILSSRCHQVPSPTLLLRRQLSLSCHLTAKPSVFTPNHSLWQ